MQGKCHAFRGPARNRVRERVTAPARRVTSRQIFPFPDPAMEAVLPRMLTLWSFAA
jgi:hypothetical protein